MPFRRLEAAVSHGMIVFVRSAPLDVTPAVQRYVSFLRANGSQERIGGVELSYLPRKTELVSFNEIVSCCRPFRSTRERMGSMLAWQTFQLRTFFRLKPGVIQFCDVFSAVPVMAAKLLLRCKVIFDIRDNAKLSVSHRSRLLGFALGCLESIAARLSDAVVSVDKPRLAYLPRAARKKAFVVPNVPAEDSFTELTFGEGDKLVVNLSGFVSHRRNLAAWGEVALQRPALKLDVYGTVADDRTAALLEKLGVGLVSPCSSAESIARMKACDAVSLMYDPTIAINRHAAPNKLYEALMLGKPVICARGMAMGDELQEWGCGLVVDYGNGEALRVAVDKLRNPDTRREMGANARRLFTSVYRDLGRQNMALLYGRMELVAPDRLETDLSDGEVPR